MNTIESKIIAIRIEHQLNQIDFSKALGISQGRLSEIEKDKNKPSAETLIEMKRKMNVDLNWLLDNDYGFDNFQMIKTLLQGMSSEDLEEVREFIKFKRSRR